MKEYKNEKLNIKIKYEDSWTFEENTYFVELYYNGTLMVTAYKNSIVYAYGSSIVYAYGSSTVYAYGNSTVIAYDNSKVSAYDNSKVYAYDNSTVSAYDNSTVDAYDSSTVDAFDSSTVTAYGNSTVRAYGNSKVRAYNNSKVEDKRKTNQQYTWHSKFNIGDKVVISGSAYKYHIINEIRINSDGYNMYCFKSTFKIANENELSLYEEPKVKEMTVKEISDLLGYEVKIVK